MGDIADMVLEGVLCEMCGGYIDDDAQGFPRRCSDCVEEERKEMGRLDTRTPPVGKGKRR